MTKLNQDDLKKGLDKLRAAAGSGSQSRSEELFAKSQSGTITSAERQELMQTLGGASGLADAATAGLRTDTIAKSIDASGFLADVKVGVEDGLRVLAERMEKSEANDQGFRVALAQSFTSLVDVVTEQAQIIKSLSSQIETFGGQPARAPKSQGVPVLEKSFAGQAPQGDELSKSQIADTIDFMISKSIPTRTGENLVMASSKFEQLGQVSPSLLAQVREVHAQHRKGN